MWFGLSLIQENERKTPGSGERCLEKFYLIREVAKMMRELRRARNKLLGLPREAVFCCQDVECFPLLL